MAANAKKCFLTCNDYSCARAGECTGAGKYEDESIKEENKTYSLKEISYSLRNSLYAKTGKLAIDGIIEDLEKSLSNGGLYPDPPYQEECCFRNCRDLPVANSGWGPICNIHSHRLAIQLLPREEPPELSNYAEDQLDQVDASVFSGDCYSDEKGKERLSWYINRWIRELKLII